MGAAIYVLNGAVVISLGLTRDPMPTVDGLAETVFKKNTKVNAKGACFPIVQTNNYGRMMIQKQMDTHDLLIEHTHTRTDAWISRIAADQMAYNRKLEKWRPGYAALQRKARTDEILASLISTATHRCDTELDEHILRFKENRARNPVFKPGWLEAYSLGKSMAVHEELLGKAGPRIDSGPPAKAIQFRDFLRSCKFTRGGFLRAELMHKLKQGKKRGKKGVAFPSIAQQPSPTLYVKQKQYDCCGREKKFNPVLVNKYSDMLFQSHVRCASNNSVRDMYTRTNLQEESLPSMGKFMRDQGVDLAALEADHAQMSEQESTIQFGLVTVTEEEDEEYYAEQETSPDEPRVTNVDTEQIELPVVEEQPPEVPVVEAPEEDAPAPPVEENETLFQIEEEPSPVEAERVPEFSVQTTSDIAVTSEVL